MPFRKTYFEKLNDLLRVYFKAVPCGAVSVTVKAYGKEFHLNKVLEVGQELITFAYYDEEKSTKLAEGKGEAMAWPALTLPYEVIESVEFDPGITRKGWKTSMGFKVTG